jgi:hypothetical protein
MPVQVGPACLVYGDDGSRGRWLPECEAPKEAARSAAHRLGTQRREAHVAVRFMKQGVPDPRLDLKHFRRLPKIRFVSHGQKDQVMIFGKHETMPGGHAGMSHLDHLRRDRQIGSHQYVKPWNVSRHERRPAP